MHSRGILKGTLHGLVFCVFAELYTCGMEFSTHVEAINLWLGIVHTCGALYLCDDVNLNSCVKSTTEPNVLCTGHIYSRYCACMRVCVCIYMYMCIRTHTHTHIYIYTHIYIQLCKYKNHPMMCTVQDSQKYKRSCFIINACIYIQLTFHHTIHSVFVCFI